MVMKYSKTNKELSRCLTHIISEFKIEQKLFAHEIGISETHLSRIVHGLQPSRNTFQKIVDYLIRKRIPQHLIDVLWKASTFVPQDGGEIHYQQIREINRMVNDSDQKEFTHYLLDELMTLTEIRFSLEKSDGLIAARNWGTAYDVLMNTKSSYRGFNLLESKLNENLARTEYGRGKYTSAIQQHQAVLVNLNELKTIIPSTGEKNKIDERIARTYIYIGNIYRRMGNWDESCNYYYKAMNIFRRVNTKESWIQVANCLRKLAGVDNYKGLPDDALKKVCWSMRLSKWCDYRNGIYKGLQHRAWSHRITGEWELSVEENQEALRLVLQDPEDLIDQWELMKAYNYLGDSFFVCGRLKEAKENYTLANNIFLKEHRSESQMRLQEGMIRLAMGISSMKEQPIFPEVEWNLEGSLLSFANAGDELWEAVARQTLGKFYLDQGERQKSIIYLEIATAQFNHLHVPRHLISSLVDQALYYYSQNNIEEVMNCLAPIFKAKQYEDGLLRKTYLEQYLSPAYIILGKVYIFQDRLSEATSAFSSALITASGYNDYVFKDCFMEIRAEMENYTRLEKLNEVGIILETCINTVENITSERCSSIAREEAIKTFSDQRETALSLLYAGKARKG